MNHAPEECACINPDIYDKRCAVTRSNRIIMNFTTALSAIFIGMLFSANAHAAVAASSGKIVGEQPIFATIGKTVITEQDFARAFAEKARAKFYHGKPTDIELATFQREVGDYLVSNVLLLNEAKHRKLKPDSKLVSQQVEAIEQRYKDNDEWKKVRAQELPLITRQFQEKNLLDQLEKLVRKVPDPNDEQLREYYAAHMDKFTAPEQQRVSLILLSVNPSSPNKVWQLAFEKGNDLVSRLHGGADFAELAREYSGDPSAEAGGDMGYLHSGMLSEAGQEQVNKLKPDEISDPVVMMEGIAIFRLTDRIPPKINKYEDIKERASGLWLTEQSNIAWQSLIAQLRTKATVHVNESLYISIPTAVDQPKKTE